MEIEMDYELWQRINRWLVAKTISELQYEECFQPEGTDDYWSLQLCSGITYSFCAWKTIWGQLRVNNDSLLRNGDPVISAAQFYIDAKYDLGLDDIVLANLLEECAATLQGDMQSWRIKQYTSASDIAEMDVDRMQPYLDGHPKAVLNKGRLGWGCDELEQYAPEYAAPFQLRWIAVQDSCCTVGTMHGADLDALVRSAMSEFDYQDMQVTLAEQGRGNQRWLCLPVHPWQWQHKIRIHYQQWIAEGRLLDLGVRGHRYLPLQSIRTLANLDHPAHPNIKLPVTILNTSCYRGIPSKYIEVGGLLSDWLHHLCQTDPLLFDHGTEVLKEPVGLFCCHPYYSQIEHSPYRYNEMLGAIWRDSVQSKMRAGERAMLMAALLQVDNAGDVVVRHLIQTSGLTASQWLAALFEAVVIPLYHLMCQYGVGLVAHGQNLTLILQNNIPKRLAIKDLQGDLRLVDQDFPELDSLDTAVRSVLTRLPAPYLLHDLQTGHFVTVLRYLSALMQEHSLISELGFYRILGDAIGHYEKACPHLQERFQLFDLLTPNIKRVCINRVRFVEGYGDRSERPLPVLGADLINPLYISTPETEQEFA